MTTGGAFTGIRRSAASAGPAAATADAVNAVEVNRWNLGRIAAPVPGIPYARINNSKRPRRANATRRRNSDAISLGGAKVQQIFNRGFGACAIRSKRQVPVLSDQLLAEVFVLPGLDEPEAGLLVDVPGGGEHAV